MKHIPESARDHVALAVKEAFEVDVLTRTMSLRLALVISDAAIAAYKEWCAKTTPGPSSAEVKQDMSRLGTPLKPTGIPFNTDGRCDLKREPGFGWRLSDEAAREIEKMESANRRALAELLARGVLVGAGSAIRIET